MRASPDRRLVAQRIEDHVDAEGVPGWSELEEISRILALALPRVVDVRIVRHEDVIAAALVGNAAAVDFDTVFTVLGGAPAGTAPTDRRNLRYGFERPLRLEQRTPG